MYIGLGHTKLLLANIIHKHQPEHFNLKQDLPSHITIVTYHEC